MRPSLRFLLLAVAGWAGMRAWTLGVFPTDMLLERSEARAVPPIASTEFPAIEPVEPAAPMHPPAYGAAPPAAGLERAAAESLRYVQGLVGVPVAMVRGVVPVYQLPPAADPDSAIPPRPARQANARLTPVPAYYSPLPPLDEWPSSRIAAMSVPVSRSSTIPNQSTPVISARKLDRLQVSAWALLRGQQGQLLGPTSLASGGQLGGSQAGTRLNYYMTRQIAATIRTTTDVGRRGAEFAGGIRVQPMQSLPVWITAERRQRLGQTSNGRNAFAIFAESGLYGQPMPWQFSLDAYLQAGMVGLKSRDYFVDGALAFTRPVYKNFSAGLGLWGGAQPGVYRIDAGPRVTMNVRSNVKVHLDWRQKLAGNAEPGSGPAVTLAADF